MNQDLKPGQNDDLGRMCKALVESTLRDGKIKDAQAIVKGVYKKSLGAPKPGKPPVQDRIAAGGKAQ